MHPPGFLNARSPEKEKPTALSAGRSPLRSLDGGCVEPTEAKTMFDLSWTKQIDWINSLNLNCPMFFFLNVWILYDLVGCWVVEPGLEIQLNLVGGKVYLPKK